MIPRKVPMGEIKLKRCSSDQCVGSDNDVEITMTDHRQDVPLFYVECPMCGLKAPWAVTQEEAADQWNGLLLVDPEILGFPEYQNP